MAHCDLKEKNQCPQTDFPQKVIFPMEFPGIIINILKETELDKCGDYRTREKKVILDKDDPLYEEATCNR